MNLSVKNKIGYGMGALTENAVQNAVNAIMPLIMFNFMGVDPVKIGWIFAVARLWDTITDPIMGFISDNTRSRWGRRKPYLLLGVALTAIAFFCMWLFPRGKSDDWYFVYLLVFCLLYYTGTTIFCVPYISMGYELASDYNERTSLMGFRSFFVNLGALLLPWMYWFVKLDCFADPLVGMRWLAVLCGVIYLAFVLGPTFLTPTPADGREDASRNRTEKCSVREIFTSFAVWPFLVMVLTLALSIVGLFLVAQFGSNVFIYYICRGDEQFASKLMGYNGTLSAISCILAIPVVNRLSRWLDKRLALALMLLTAAAGNLSGLLLWTPAHPYLAILPAIPGAIGISGLWIMLGSMMADVCDYDLNRNACRRQGVFAAIISWTTKLGYSVCSIFAGYFLKWSGFILDLHENQSPETFLSMRLYLSLLPASGLLLATLILVIYPLNRAKVKTIQAELEAKGLREPESANP